MVEKGEVSPFSLERETALIRMMVSVETEQ